MMARFYSQCDWCGKELRWWQKKREIYHKECWENKQERDRISKYRVYAMIGDDMLPITDFADAIDAVIWLVDKEEVKDVFDLKPYEPYFYWYGRNWRLKRPSHLAENTE